MRQTVAELAVAERERIAQDLRAASECGEWCVFRWLSAASQHQGGAKESLSDKQRSGTRSGFIKVGGTGVAFL